MTCLLAILRSREVVGQAARVGRRYHGKAECPLIESESISRAELGQSETVPALVPTIQSIRSRCLDRCNRVERPRPASFEFLLDRIRNGAVGDSGNPQSCVQTDRFGDELDGPITHQRVESTGMHAANSTPFPNPPESGLALEGR